MHPQPHATQTVLEVSSNRAEGGGEDGLEVEIDQCYTPQNAQLCTINVVCPCQLVSSFNQHSAVHCQNVISTK